MSTSSRLRIAVLAYAFAFLLTGCGGGDGGGGGSTGGGGGNNAGYNGFTPNSLSGRTMLGTRTFTSTGPVGQTHHYTFSGSRFHDSDPPEESEGNFTYNPANNAAVLDLDYTGPASFSNDSHHLDLMFTEKDKGDFTSTYKKG